MKIVDKLLCLKTTFVRWLQTPAGQMIFFGLVIILPWMVGWVRNAEFGAKYSLSELRDMYGWMATQMGAYHFINSKWNSPPSKPPGEDSTTAQSAPPTQEHSDKD